MTITFPDEAYADAHGNHIYFWSDNAKTKNDEKAFTMTLLSLWLTLLDIVKNNLLIAW